MTEEYLERRLDYGEHFGFVKETGDPDTLGWVLLRKRKPKPITPVDPAAEPERFLRWKEKTESLRERPYNVTIIEQQWAIYEIAEYEETEEWGQKGNYNFATLEEVSQFLAEQGFSLENIKRAYDIGAP